MTEERCAPRCEGTRVSRGNTCVVCVVCRVCRLSYVLSCKYRIGVSRTCVYYAEVDSESPVRGGGGLGPYRGVPRCCDMFGPYGIKVSFGLGALGT